MQVPLQTVPGVQLERGSEVQYGAVGVEPARDVVSDDITRQAKAFQKTGEIIQKLDDELNDAEAKRLANNYSADVTAIRNEYKNLKGVNAVGMVEVDGEKISVYDQYNNKLKTTLESYQEKASNGVVRYIFDNKASVYTRAVQNDMTAWSLNQQRSYNENETESAITSAETRAGDAYKTWADPSGAFNIARLEALAAIDEYALLMGWNIDPNAIDPTDPEGKRKLGISEQYLEKRNKFNIDLAETVLKKLSEDGDQAGIRSFLAAIKPDVDEKTYKTIESKVEVKSEENNGDKKVKAVLVNNANPNDGNFLNQATLLSGLSSNQSFDDGKGASVTDGLHSDEFDTSNTKQTENFETLSKLKSTSKFYQPDSNVRLIPQHQTTHLFAIQVLGVKKADSLYTKAKRSIKIDPQRFKDDPDYAKEMNIKILDKYNELIVGSTSRQYFLFDGTYVNKVTNDLQVIKEGVDYDFNPDDESTIEVNEVTGLQPLKVLKAKLKATTKDPKQLEYELKNLEIEYNKIKTEKEAIYNEALNKAKEIALAEPGGWKQLAANGIDIEGFTKADQEMLKQGPPEESNIEVVANLDANPAEVRDNLPAYRDQISPTQYAGLERYAQTLKTSESKYIEATGDSTLFKDTLYKNGYTWAHDTLKGKNAATFHSIKTEWIDRIDYVQTHVEKRKLTREEKLKLLNNVLIDKVSVDENILGIGARRDISIGEIINPDKLKKTFVNVKVKQENGKFKKERIYGSDIKDLVQAEIMGYLYRNKKAMSQQKIAEIWVKFGRPESVEQFKKNVKAATLSLSTR